MKVKILQQLFSCVCIKFILRCSGVVIFLKFQGDSVMKIGKIMMAILLVLPCTLTPSGTLIEQAMEFAAKNINVQNCGAAAALVSGFAQQLYNEKSTLNPFILEMREAHKQYGSSIAAGLQAAGVSVHVKVPGAMNLDCAKAEFAPFFAMDYAARSDKSIPLEKRTDADNKPVISVRAGLSENCKIEARCHAKTAMYAAGAAVVFVAGQAVCAAVSGK